MRPGRGTHLILALAASNGLLAGIAGATTYACANREFEIACGRDRCERSESHTPMSVAVNVATRQVEVCAYSGCWSGRADTLVSRGDHLLVRADRMRRGAGGGTRTEAGASVVIDRRAMAGMVLAFGFVNPLSCSRE